MNRKILVIQGHPDKQQNHFCHALQHAYVDAAKDAGYEVREIVVACIDFTLLRNSEEFEDKVLLPDIKKAQEAILWANHLLIIYPLWLGTMPALLKGFFEQVFRPGFAIPESTNIWEKRLKGRTAHVVVTMGMPALAYRWFFGAHGLKNLQCNILKFCGIKPVKTTLIGSVDKGKDKQLKKWITKIGLLAKKY